MFELFVFLAIAAAILITLFLSWTAFIIINIVAHSDFEEYPEIDNEPRKAN